MADGPIGFKSITDETNIDVIYWWIDKTKPWQPGTGTAPFQPVAKKVL